MSKNLNLIRIFEDAQVLNKKSENYLFFELKKNKILINYELNIILKYSKFYKICFFITINKY